MNPPATTDLEESLSRWLGQPTHIVDRRVVTAGDSHQALKVSTGESNWFVKWNSLLAYPALAAEAEGLSELHRLAPDCLEIPQSLGVAQNHKHAWLILPWHDMHGQGDPATLGNALEQFHRCSATRYGWHGNNFLGASGQQNDWNDSWADFWWQCRLAPQLETARTRGYDAQLAGHWASLKQTTEQLLNHDPEPALVHGDLWSGNCAYLAEGKPILFDAAPYYGDRETDLAMMRLFGGFSPTVFEVYESKWPLPRGAADREPLYQLYHLLNHLNLFGSGWLPRVQQAIISLRQ